MQQSEGKVLYQQANARKTSLLVVIAMALFGCAPRLPEIKPDYVHPNYPTSKNLAVAFMPPMDSRGDKTEDISEALIEVKEDIEPVMREKGYDFTAYPTWPTLNGTAPERVEQVQTWLNSLSGVPERYVMVMEVTHAGSTSTGAGLVNGASATGYMFDRDSGEMVWKHSDADGVITGVGDVVTSPLMALMTASVSGGFMAKGAMWRVARSVPQATE